jgi:hypothetical protein
MNHNKDKTVVIATVVTLALLVAIPTIAIVAYYKSDTIYEACMVEEKESISTEEGHEYRVYTDCGNFKVSDEFWGANFSASDTYASMKEGHAYDLRTHGWRRPIFSMFPNIYTATPTGETAR